MKKILSIALILCLTLTIFSACTQNTGNNGTEIAVVMDSSASVDDKSFNQGVWEGVREYAEMANISHKYYKSVEKTTDSYLESIDLAVSQGAKVILCSGYYFEQAVFIAQNKYPDIDFIVVECAPNNGDGIEVIADNTYPMFYAEEESGFLAGYAAVKDGYRKLGFMGGVATPPVIRFGYGFVQGAEYAARELNLAKNAIEMKYTYLGNFDASPENQTVASSWYSQGTEIIFACGGAAGNSVMAAAESAGKKVIGVDVDQSGESDTVITSALKEVKTSTYSALESYYNDGFKGGTKGIFDITVGGVGLPMENSKFEKFTQEHYENIYAKLVDNTDNIRENILDHTGAETAKNLNTKSVNVVIVK